MDVQQRAAQDLADHVNATVGGGFRPIHYMQGWCIVGAPFGDGTLYDFGPYSDVELSNPSRLKQRIDASLKAMKSDIA